MSSGGSVRCWTPPSANPCPGRWVPPVGAGAFAAIESDVPGRSVSSLTNASGRSLNRKLEDFELVARWIREFDRQAQGREPWDQATLRQWVETPVGRYWAAFRVGPVGERALAAVHQCGQSLRGVPLPIVRAHPDQNPASVLISDRQVGVIDWSGALESLPMFAFLYFVVLWAGSFMRNGAPRRGCADSACSSSFPRAPIRLRQPFAAP